MKLKSTALLALRVALAPLLAKRSKPTFVGVGVLDHLPLLLPILYVNTGTLHCHSADLVQPLAQYLSVAFIVNAAVDASITSTSASLVPQMTYTHRACSTFQQSVRSLPCIQ